MQTILIVEAVEAHRDNLLHWLRGDYTVFTAADGATGVALAAQLEPDLIFMALPGSDGGEAVRRIRAQARLRTIPIIALTAQSMPAVEATVRAAGCVDALRTPPTAAQLYTTLRKWLGGG